MHHARGYSGEYINSECIYTDADRIINKYKFERYSNDFKGKFSSKL